MKRAGILLLITIIYLFVISSCGKSFSGDDICEPMREFLQIISDPDKPPTMALERFAQSNELVRHDLAYYNVSNPEIVIAEKDFYKVRMKNGVTIREFDFYWEEGKIVDIIDLGIIR